MARAITGLGSAFKKILADPAVPNAIAKGINNKAATQTPGGNLYSDENIRIDRGHVDHNDPDVVHCDLQINAQTKVPALKRHVNAQGTHAKVVKFPVNTATGVTGQEIKTTILNGLS